MDKEEMTGTWKLVAEGNDRAFMTAMEGNVEEALVHLDQVRDEAIKIESDQVLKNEIECRRLEMRLQIAANSINWDLFWRCMQDIGKSQKFEVERLHEVVVNAGEHMRNMLKGDGA